MPIRLALAGNRRKKRHIVRTREICKASVCGTSASLTPLRSSSTLVLHSSKKASKQASEENLLIKGFDSSRTLVNCIGGVLPISRCLTLSSIHAAAVWCPAAPCKILECVPLYFNSFAQVNSWGVWFGYRIVKSLSVFLSSGGRPSVLRTRSVT